MSHTRLNGGVAGAVWTIRLPSYSVMGLKIHLLSGSGAPCGSRGPGVKGTAARGTGLEPYKGKLREKVCQCKPHPPGYLPVSGRSGASGTGRNGKEDVLSHLLLWKDIHTQGSFRAEDLRILPPPGKRIQGTLHSMPHRPPESALPLNPGLRPIRIGSEEL